MGHGQSRRTRPALARRTRSLQNARASVPTPTNSSADPGVVEPVRRVGTFATWRQNPAFVDATLSTVELPANQLGDYHLADCPASPACNLGAASKGAVNAPATDFDDQQRPALGGFDAGADEFGASIPPPPARYGLLLLDLRQHQPARGGRHVPTTRTCTAGTARPSAGSGTRARTVQPGRTWTPSPWSTRPTSTCPSPGDNFNLPGVVGR